MSIPLVLTTRPLRDHQPLGSYQRDGKLYVSTRDNFAWRNGKGGRMQPRVRVMLCALAASPCYLSGLELFDNMYCDRSDGGPELMNNAVRTSMFRLRPFCEMLGLRIVSLHGRGWTLEEAAMCEAAE